MVLFIIGILALVAIGVSSWLRAVEYENTVGVHLHYISHAVTAAKAKEYLQDAIRGLSKLKLTSGNTSVVVFYERNDLTRWMKSLLDGIAALEEVEKNTGKELSLFESQQVLDEVQKTTRGCPKDIHLYPHNGAYFWLSLVAWIATVVGAYMWIFDAIVK